MGIVERRQRQREEVRQDIIKTAWDMVQKDGWQALSIRKIADAIEYSVPVIYDHFENKEAILLEFGKKGFRKLTEKLEAARNCCSTPEDKIKAMADAYWDFAFNNIQLYQLMFGIGMASCESGKCTTEFETFSDMLMEPIQEMLTKHNRSDVSACLKYHTLWSVMHGLVSIKISGTSPADKELNKMVLDDAVNGYIRNLK
ncbi:TetR/AcrR family transcriptional regulator [Mucilaginibacter sp. RS28]|uniref:TetR/AcrR family transcriptional regulator n=1 Tax=Mucilaginibacter straminoryzae TaxID=2932774 RepID=A0A9X1X2R2_9SPHI|nr:TetR/AcrR family transcriptional regulator [Mucilaginibacter straminoryzae]MCJ8209556.1 TetR/AcrR family transcriptional regulator [Mucilaginibacter straminoryzae]